jgi:hypothetical protein
MAKPLVFEAWMPNNKRPLFSETYFLQPVSDITPVQEDVCSYAVTPLPPESEQGYYSLLVMKLDGGIAAALTCHSLLLFRAAKKPPCRKLLKGWTSFCFAAESLVSHRRFERRTP